MKSIPLLGLLGTGANFAKTLLENNYDIVFSNQGIGWTHGLVATVTEASEMAYKPLVIIENPYATLSAWYQIHLGDTGFIKSKAKTFAEFIRSNIIFYNGAASIRPEYGFSNPIAMWNCVVRNHVSIARQTNGLVVKYEDLLLKPEITANTIAHWWGAEKKAAGFTVPSGLLTSGARRGYVRNYSNDDFTVMEELLDTELLSEFAYPNEGRTVADAESGEIFTVANDRMAKNLATLLFSVKENSGFDTSRVRVIPFDDNIATVRDICAAYGVKILEPTRNWDRLGKALFKDEEYRPNVPAWRYFRKLNALSHAKGRFAFLDANCVILSSLIPVFAGLAEYDVIFGNYSAKNRNFKQPLEMLLNIANPKIKQGFNAGFWVTSFDPKLVDALQAYTKTDIRPYLTKSPEQSVLSMALALSGKKLSKLGGACPGLCVTSAKSNVLHQEGKIVSKGPFGEQTVVSMKWNGSIMQLKDDMPNKDIYLHYLNGAIAFLLQKNPSAFAGISEAWLSD